MFTDIKELIAEDRIHESISKLRENSYGFQFEEPSDPDFRTLPRLKRKGFCRCTFRSGNRNQEIEIRKNKIRKTLIEIISEIDRIEEVRSKPSPLQFEKKSNPFSFWLLEGLQYVVAVLLIFLLLFSYPNSNWLEASSTQKLYAHYSFDREVVLYSETR